MFIVLQCLLCGVFVLTLKNESFPLQTVPSWFPCSRRAGILVSSFPVKCAEAKCVIIFNGPGWYARKERGKMSLGVRSEKSLQCTKWIMKRMWEDRKDYYQNMRKLRVYSAGQEVIFEWMYDRTHCVGAFQESRKQIIEVFPRFPHLHRQCLP